jgi:acyl-coenzyme A synthetase/AMP-(fatty) acid ligase
MGRSERGQSHDGKCAFLLPQVLENVAQDEPTRTWCTVPHSPDLQNGWKDITFEELNDAVNGFARWVEHNIGVGNGKEVMTYIG